MSDRKSTAERLPLKTGFLVAALTVLVKLLLYDEVWSSGGLRFWNSVFRSHRRFFDPAGIRPREVSVRVGGRRYWSLVAGTR
jgi:hypothetical protein